MNEKVRISRCAAEIEIRAARAQRERARRREIARARERDWLGRLLDVQPIEGSAELNIDGEQIRLANLALTGGPLLLLSDITLANQQANGALYARLGALGIGVELVESEPTLRVIQPRRWFDQWRATQRP